MVEFEIVAVVSMARSRGGHSTRMALMMGVLVTVVLWLAVSMFVLFHVRAHGCARLADVGAD